MDRPRQPLPTRVEGLPDLPSAYHAALDAGLRELGLDLTPAARGAIDGHVRLLLAWNRAINLTAIRDPAEIAVRHVLDSLTAVPLLAGGTDEATGSGRRRTTAGDALDLGSGGGFPGLPVLVALRAVRGLLVDAVGKKAAFLATVVEAVGLEGRVGVDHRRAEALAADPRHRERWGAVLARAVGPLGELVELAFPLLVPGGRLVAWKRTGSEGSGEELAAAGRAGAVLGGASIEVREVAVTGLEEHRLVVVTKRGMTPAGYPRDPAARRRNPW